MSGVKETATQVLRCVKIFELLTVHKLLDTSFTSSYSNLLNTFQGPSSTSAEARIRPLKQVTLVNALQRLRSSALIERSSVQANSLSLCIMYSHLGTLAGRWKCEARSLRFYVVWYSSWYGE